MKSIRMALLLAVGGLLCISCASKSALDAEKANEKRWDNYQKENKRDMGVAASAFERRQAQLAEKRKKAAEQKSDAKKTTP